MIDARDEQRQGLSDEDAAGRLLEHGPNEIRRAEGRPAWRMFLGQFKSAFILLLAAAAGVSVALSEYADAIAIGAIVVLNSVVGFLQEHKAERALLALRSLTAPRARVRRAGRSVVIPAAQIVPGDLLELEAGDVVAADALLLDASVLATNEAALTGESLPVEKSTRPVAEDAPLADRTNRVFLGTAVASGTGLARVIATGMRTELGHIAHLLARTEETQTPLQERLAVVARTLAVGCLAIVAVVAAFGLQSGLPWSEVLLSAISLAVAAVPEGLPAVVTIALAVGVQRLAKRHVLVRRLPAVETLGCVTVICTDKTGTLTEGVMAVREVVGDERAVLAAAAACCDAELGPDGRAGAGDPTELALLAAAAAHGVHRADLERDNRRTASTPFDSTRKLMSVSRADGVLYVKGAFESLLPLCTSGAEELREANDALAAKGLRVLGVATGRGTEERALRLVGLVGLADPPRASAIEALEQAHRAGIRTVMITGDHPATARAIAREMGLARPEDDLEAIVHARVTASDKLDIVRRWKERGEIVAMTGDGVNDAPALKESHIGIAMGRTGTEVTREASDMVLADDDYRSIVAAVREGRGIYENIRKTLTYLLAGNVGEVVLMLVAAMAGLPLPLLPIQLLWVNLVTDGLPALALVTDPVQDDVLARPPRPPDEPILGRPQWRLVVATGLLEAGVVLGAFRWALEHEDVHHARAFAFTTLVFAELLRAFAARSRSRLLWEVGPFTNVRLLLVVALSVTLHLLLMTVPSLRDLFGLTALDGELLLRAGLLALIPVSLLELSKLPRRLARR